MSYSFDVLAKDKDEAKAKAAEELDKVRTQQPIHAKDRENALTGVYEALDLLTVPEGRQVRLSVSGSVGWNGVVQDENIDAVELNSVSLNVSVSLV